MKLILHCNMNEPQWENSKEVVALGRGERVLFTLKLLCALWEDVCYKISSFIHRLKAWLKIPHTKFFSKFRRTYFYLQPYLCWSYFFIFYIKCYLYFLLYDYPPPLPPPPKKKPGKTLKLLSSDKKFFPAYHLLAVPR